MPAYETESAGLGYSGQGNLNGSGKSYLPTAVRTDTELDTVRAAMKQAHELSEYVRSIVDRIVGAQPEESSSMDPMGKQLMPSGIIPNLGYEAREAQRAMNKAMSALRGLSDQIS